MGRSFLGEIQEDLGDFLAGVAFSEGVGVLDAFLGTSRGGNYFGGCHADDGVPAGFHGFDPLGFVAQGDAGDLEKEGFLLDAAGIREDGFGLGFESEHIEVGDGLDEVEIFCGCAGIFQGAGGIENFSGAGMQGQDDRSGGGELGERGENFAKALRVVGIFRAMDCGEDELLGLKLQILQDARVFFREVAVEEDRVIHDVAHAMHAALDAFVVEIFVGGFSGREKEQRDVVGEDAIDFLGHAAIEGAETGFDMGDGNVEFYGGEGSGESGIGVAIDEDEIGLVLREDLLDGFEHFAGLGAVGAGTDAEIVIGRGDLQLFEENAGHVVVVMLARVDEDFLDAGGAECSADDGSFDELRARSDDGDDFQACKPRQ